MNILDDNKTILLNMLNAYPNLQGLKIEGNQLYYNKDSIGIDTFSIRELINSDSDFGASLDLLTPEEAFRIIRLHAIFLESKLNKEQEIDNEKTIEIIKQNNPLMNNVSLVSKNNNGINEYMLNVVDSLGQDHLFSIDRTFDVFSLYSELSARYGRKEITPDEFVAEINRKLPEIKLDSATNLIDNSQVTEDFRNKVKLQNDKHLGDMTTKVMGNEQYDVVVVGDENGKHEVITYSRDQYGNLISNTHGQNISSEMTTTQENGQDVSTLSDNNVNNIDSSNEVTNDPNGKEEEKVELISFEKYKELVNSSVQFDEIDKKNIEFFYGYMGELLLYENFLMEELKQLLVQFKQFITELQIQSSESELNDHQNEALEKYDELVMQAKDNKDKDMSMVNEDVKKLQLIYQAANNNQDGFMSTYQIIAFIIFWSFVITMIALIILK